jgi:hypothetical protein
VQIFIDDERLPPDNTWTVVREGQTAIDLIRSNSNEITIISFDNDLGGELEGVDVLKAILGSPVEDGIELPRLETIIVHSANTVANREIRMKAEGARKAGRFPEALEILDRSALEYNYGIIERD